MAPMIDQIPDVEREAFNHIGYTIGGRIVFPADQRRSQDDDQRGACIGREDQRTGSI